MQQLMKKFNKKETLYINKEHKDFDFLHDDNTLNIYLEKKIKD